MNIKFKNLAALAGLSLVLLAPVSAVTLTINEGNGGAPGGMVGEINPATPANLANEVIFVNNLLGLNANVVQVIGGNTYDTTAFNFNGTVSAVGALDFPSNPPGTIPAGYEFVLGKFGQHGLVWYLGGASFDIATPVDANGSPLEGFGLSHWVAFNPTSDTPSVPDGGMTVLLLGAALAGMSMIARRRSAK